MSDTHSLEHQRYMARALFLASKGVGFTSPNPMVGAVIVKNGAIIGEGWHRQAGGPHAEVEALRSAKESVVGATMYVTLEPCCHFGRTPPCSQAVIDAGIAEVYYAAADANPKVAGGGHRHMLEAGIRVHHGPHIEAATQLNRAFFHFIKTQKPFVVAKFAMSLDGCIATHTGASQWITDATSRQHGMELRHFCDGILVGSGTVQADNPRLTTRQLTEKTAALNTCLYPLQSLLQRFPDANGPSRFHPDAEGFTAPSQSPLRVILDSRRGLEPAAQVFSQDLPNQALLFSARSRDPQTLAAFEAQGVTVIQTASNAQGQISLQDVLHHCGQRDMVSLMVEGGSSVHGSLFAAGLVDEVWAFVAPKIIGGQNAPGPVGGTGAATLADSLELEWISHEILAGDLLLRARPKRVPNAQDIET